MKFRLFAALAATCLAMLQSCDSSQSLASTPGDRSSEGKGGIAFRLSQQNANVLRASAYALRYRVSGPGLDTSAIFGMITPDTAPAFITNIPAGTRIIEITAVDYNNLPTWYGADTIEVNPGQLSFAHITLRKLATPYGSVVLDLSLDSMDATDSIPSWGRIDTIWNSRIIPSWYEASYTECNGPTWGGPGDSLQIHCTLTKYVRIPGDTTWVDSIVNHPVPDTAIWCHLTYADSLQNATDTIGLPRYTCYRNVFRPDSGDSMSRPVKKPRKR